MMPEPKVEMPGDRATVAMLETTLQGLVWLRAEAIPAANADLLAAVERVGPYARSCLDFEAACLELREVRQRRTPDDRGNVPPWNPK